MQVQRRFPRSRKTQHNKWSSHACKTAVSYTFTGPGTIKPDLPTKRKAKNKKNENDKKKKKKKDKKKRTCNHSAFSMRLQKMYAMIQPAPAQRPHKPSKRVPKGSQQYQREPKDSPGEPKAPKRTARERQRHPRGCQRVPKESQRPPTRLPKLSKNCERAQSKSLTF